MSLETLAYPFLFLAIFFEAFMLVTFLSEPARRVRQRSAACAESVLPKVAIIVPCWNEAETVGVTADSILALDYPADKLQMILVDDGSTDGTALAMERFAVNPQVTIIHKENGGKHTAINAGIATTDAAIIGCLDADSLVEPDALYEMIPCFDVPRVAAATAAMSVYQPGNFLEHMQNAEYIFGITRQHTMSVVNGIHVTPGPFSLYRREVVEALGGFKKGYQTEDLEMALRLQKAGYTIGNAPRARVYTKAPRTLFALVKQRTRWTSGFMRNVLNEYRSLIGDSRYGALGMLTLPLGVLTIGSGIMLFLVGIFEFVTNTFAAAAIRTGIPLSYSLVPHSFDWFYLPSSVYVLLSTLTVLAALAMIIIGKRLSKTGGSLTLGLISYLLLYGFVAPLWLIRASTDVALGIKRGWR